jgi:hypothetical protein
MRKINFSTLFAGFVLVAITALWATLSAIRIGTIPAPRPDAPLGPAEIAVYNPDQTQRIIDKLIELESSGNPKAINFLDRDGTASFGCLQFKPTSFRGYGIRYGFFGEKVSWDWLMTKIFDCDLQKQIARAMILDQTVDKNNKWPTAWPKVKDSH